MAFSRHRDFRQPAGRLKTRPIHRASALQAVGLGYRYPELHFYANAIQAICQYPFYKIDALIPIALYHRLLFTSAYDKLF
jgi:hypothetical protein